MTEDDQKQKCFDVSVAIRNLEIDLFWKRSLFFWGFIASAFVGYAALRHLNSEVSIVVACFGMVCSFAWTLLNRGSKYWQETWEARVERFERDVTGPLFAKEEPVKTYKGPWLCARQYSVSKLAIALSDYVFTVWITILLLELYAHFLPINTKFQINGVVITWL